MPSKGMSRTSPAIMDEHQRKAAGPGRSSRVFCFFMVLVYDKIDYKPYVYRQTTHVCQGPEQCNDDALRTVRQRSELLA